MQVDRQSNLHSSLNLREKTSIAVTSKGHSEVEDDKRALCTSTRRRCITRGLANSNTAAAESVMVQAQRQEEFLKSKEEKRLREQERREVEEACQKEAEEWERNLLALSKPTSIKTMWEIPAIGHFLCLAQQILNLPEIVFYELERCLLMPQCNVFLSKIMTSLLSTPHRRPTLHRRPNLPYKEWERALGQRIQQWYTMIGQAENPDHCAEKLGLCSQFFMVLGEINPLEKTAFHELPFYQKVWLLKGLCDFVYETQSEVQDAVLGQPIHECRELILGYDSQENAYIHFPQFCGADVRVYKQRPFRAPEYPVPPVKVKRALKSRLVRAKCKFSNKCNGDLRTAKKVLPEIYKACFQSCERQEHCHEKPQVENCSSTVQDAKIICETKAHLPCNTTETVCFKENVEKPISPGEVVGYGEPLSPGEIRVLEDVNKYGEATRGKSEFSPLKENAFKTCQIHVNKNHTDSPDVICHQVAMDKILDSSLLNHKKLKLGRIRAKKKKNKKFKDVINDYLHVKCDNLQLHKFRSLKTEIQSKLYFTKKRAKHKKHKSGKNTVFKKTVTKKRKTTTNSPTAPEFQLVCTNLDELRELIKKIEGELKVLETNKKKSEKWYFRRQGVKELHSTLVRLLNELLPWEPKLQKAFQKHRARLKKDFDDFKKLPEYRNFTREHGSCEEYEASKSPSSATSTPAICHQNILKDDKLDTPKLKEMDAHERDKLTKNESLIRDLSPVRQCRSSMSPGAEAKDFVLRKKAKLCAQVDNLHCTEVTQTCCGLKDVKQVKLEGQHISKDMICASVTDSAKGTKPIQALIAKNTGNKVTLTSHQTQSTDETVCAGETSAISYTQSVQTKPLLTDQATSKNPLQRIYKLPDGQCIPIDLQNSMVKIQVQPMTDSKTGENIMQQVLFLQKNLYIQCKEEKADAKASQQMQSNTGGQLCISNETNSIPPKSFAFLEKTFALTPSVHSTSMVHFKKHSSPAVVPETVISTPDINVSQSQCDKGTTKIPVLGTLQASLGQSGTCLPVQSDTAKAPQTKDIANHTLNLSPATTREPSESKQELRTVCIRDSQSILVRTRGGNTGVVKVQTNQDQTTNPNSVFSFTPQLQSFLVSKVKTLTSSTSTSVPPVLSLPPPGFYSSSEYSQISSESVSGGLNQVSGTNTKLSQRQTYNSDFISKVSDNLQPSNLLSSVPSTSSWLPSNSWGNMNAAVSTSNLCHDGSSRGRSGIMVSAADIKQPEQKISKISVVQPDSTTSRGELVNVPNLQRVKLVTSSVLTPGNATNMNVSATQTSCSSTPQKFVFFNTQVPTGLPSTTIAVQSTKQTVPSFVGKTHAKMSEQSQIILIPSTLGTPVKMSSTPIVSQVKDFKIGLTIGQTIVNTGHAAKNILPVHILQTTLTKGEQSVLKKTVVSDVTNLISGPENGGHIVGQNPNYDCTLNTAKWPAGYAAASSVNSVVAHTSSTDQNNSHVASNVPALPNRLSSTNISNTVAISTVKTGHLSSSVLLSTTQMAGQVKSTLSSFHIPVSPTFSTSCEPSNATTPISSASQPFSKDETINFPTQIYCKTLSTNVCTSQGLHTSSTTVTKPRSDSFFSQGSSVPLQIPSVLPSTQLCGQLNDSCFQQKIVINTSTPLAPGTQITINGTCFIVPPQGLGVGSHVVLISPCIKQGFPLVGNSRQTGHGLGINNATEQQITLNQNMPLAQDLNKSLTISKNMNSFGTTNLLPAVQASTLIRMSKDSAPVDGVPLEYPVYNCT
ncbi:uncharacterized protein KIAA2026 [Xenopus laevis]|uniref:Uncharacterized protein KIAA2026 n=2 Tax=Xenopus laevis TaxID=8355 RepID=A0A1L8HY48_XENLA|nr:uncharacterized protein KIAA2026 [Xenopus laevis]OCU01036.1 hypothetical protein XELAEV_18006818mg [Xenopus laevis]